MLSAISSNLAGFLASYRVVSSTKPRAVGSLISASGMDSVTRNGSLRAAAGRPRSFIEVAWNCSCKTYCVETCTHGRRSVTMVHLLDYISGQPPTQSVGPSGGLTHE